MTALTARFINIAAIAATGFSLMLAAGNAPAEASVSNEVVARVQLSTQTMQVSVGGRPTYEWKVSTAGKGYVTPTGSWKPYRMHEMWYSKKYDNAPMPHSVFFTGGYAVHATPHVKNLGRPASHGCIRLHPTNAEAFYTLVKTFGQQNTRIVIVQ
ncbi:L,D-transpeptidase catalytic domain [Mesorhizobium australicum]|uniref:L,D-transpeptidase catalytic domain n=2 Tax=Mesorhizobium australicum TaxID=536018 RepID=A0A1X7P7E7_9HYPH|nr:L,D-transpeptidase catalytic domain [Mesorhizobium australicum]